MRTNIKKRLQLLALAVVIYSIGFNFLPETLAQTGQWQDLMPVIIASLGYFLFLPVMYWILIIKGNQQKPWKMLLILSLSGAMARWSFPESIAQYFEFLMWVKYPIIAIVVIFELYLMYTIIKGIWGARKLSGDPRLHTLKTYADDEKKLTAGLPFAWEPATWYYAIPRFSRNHLPSLPSLNLSAATRWNYFISMFVLIAVGVASYWALVDWSEIAALFVSCFILYSSVFLSARHRVARHYSLYISGENLVINGSFWGISVVPLVDISRVELVDDGELEAAQQQIKAKKKTAKAINANSSESGDSKGLETESSAETLAEDSSIEPLAFGKSNKARSVKLTFDKPAIYHGMLGQFPEKYLTCYLSAKEGEQLIKALEQAITENASEVNEDNQAA